MTKETVNSPSRYGLVFILATLALMVWLIERFTGKAQSSASDHDKEAVKLRAEIETLKSQLEQSQLDLKQVKLDRKAHQRNGKVPPSGNNVKPRKKPEKV